MVLLNIVITLKVTYMYEAHYFVKRHALHKRSSLFNLHTMVKNIQIVIHQFILLFFLILPYETDNKMSINKQRIPWCKVVLLNISRHIQGNLYVLTTNDMFCLRDIHWTNTVAYSTYTSLYITSKSMVNFQLNLSCLYYASEKIIKIPINKQHIPLC